MAGAGCDGRAGAPGRSTPGMLATSAGSGVSTHGISRFSGGNWPVGTTDSEPASGSVTYRLSSARFRTIRARRPLKLSPLPIFTPKRPERSVRLTRPTSLPSVGSRRTMMFGFEARTYTEPLASDAATAAGSIGSMYRMTPWDAGLITANSWLAVLTPYTSPRDVATPARPTPVALTRPGTCLLGTSINVTCPPRRLAYSVWRPG